MKMNGDCICGLLPVGQATLHCLEGCAIGEMLGMVLATAFAFGNAISIGLSVVLSFFFGYLLTVGPVLRAGVPF
jgi:hypothetical protein